MTHDTFPARMRGRMHALTRIAVILSLLVAFVAEASHSHEDEAGPAAECAVCLLGKAPGHTAGSHAPAFTGPNLLPAASIPEPRLAPAALHFSPHRSRAPPLSASL